MEWNCFNLFINLKNVSMKRITSILVFLVFIGCLAFSQEVQITGTVTSAEDGSVLPGVSIVSQGAKTGTTTNVDGNYSINVPVGSVLVFNFVGMKSQEITVGEQTKINVVLENDALQVSEVVVTALGISKPKKALGYAVTEFKSEEFEKLQVVDASQALQGKVAGVSISTSSGAPGASTRVLVRGVSSLTGSNQPLYVIDGVPIDNSYTNANSTQAATNATRTVDFGNAASDINPADIESISVLKGAAATSLYGSRASNGVIIIKTKTGKKGEDMKVSISSSASITEVGRLPYYQKKFGQGWSGHFDPIENGSWGPKMDGKERLTGNTVDGARRYMPFKYQENSLRDFYEYGYSRDNSISLTGGSENLGYFVSLANTKQDGVVPGPVDVMNRNAITFKANGGYKKTKIEFGVNFVNKKIKAVATGQGDDAGGGKTLYQELLQNPVNHYVPYYRDYENDFDNLDNYYTPYAQNPYYIINENGNIFKQNRIISNVNISQELFKGLSLVWRGGMDHYTNFYKDWGAKATITPETPNSTANNVAGMVKEEGRTISDYTSDLVINYDGLFNIGSGTLEYNVMAGNNIIQNYNKRVTTISKGLVVPKYYDIRNISGSPEVSTNEELRRLVGIYGQIGLNYNNYLFLQITVRNDWSSTLPKESNSYFYPGVNAGFVFTDLMPKNNILSFGKLRASYAVAGKDADPYQLEGVYTSARIRAGGFGTSVYPVGSIPAYEKSNILGNPTMKPEISKETEIGLDLRFLNGRVGIDVAGYKKVTTDLIMASSIASSSGYAIKTFNIGQITNTGLELQLNLVPVSTKNFSWDIVYTFTKSNTILDKLSAELGVSEYIINTAYEAEFVAIPGEQLGQFRLPGYKYSPEGKIIVGDNGLPLEGGKELYGSSVPDYNMSLNNTFSYKGLSLSFLFDYQKGGYMWSYTSDITFWSGNNEQSITNDRRPWVVPNSVVEVFDANGKVIGYEENSTPILNNWHEYYSSNTNKPIERIRMVEKTYLKLRELSLNYSIKQSLVDKIGFLASASISLYGKNLFLWTPAGNSFIDPESSTYGNDLEGMFGEFGGAPSVRNYGIRLNLSF